MVQGEACVSRLKSFVSGFDHVRGLVFLPLRPCVCFGGFVSSVFSLALELFSVGLVVRESLTATTLLN